MIVILTLIVGGFIQGTTGSGFGVTTAPVLLIIAPQLVPGPLLMVAAGVCALGAWRERAHIDRRFVLRCSAAAAPGTVAGIIMVRFVASDVLMVITAAAVVAAGCVGLSGVRLPLTERTIVAAGFLSGAMNYTAALPGPPLTMTYRTRDAAQMRSTLSAVFAVMSAATAAVLIGRGGEHLAEVSTAALLAVPVAVGAVGARLVAHRLSAVSVVRAGLGLSIVAGGGLLLTHL